MGNQSHNTSFHDLDAEFLQAGVPLRYRPLECFNRLYGPVQDKGRRKELFDPIVLWYLDQYGDAARWDGVVGKFPILIRRELYLGVARFLEEGEVMVDYKADIEELPEKIAGSLTLEEYRPVAERMTNANSGFRSLYNLAIDVDCLQSKERGWTRRACYDLEGAAALLKHTGDTQTAIFLAHSAAEKFFKTAFSKAGSTRNPESFGHDIPRLFHELVKVAPRYSWLSKPMENLQSLYAPKMGLRYEQVARSMERAVTAFHGSLFICGTLAEMWLFDKARGTSKSNFRVCSFYINGQGNSFYCQQIKDGYALMTLFNSSKYLGSQMADIPMNIDQSALYIEVTDPKQDAQLRRQLAAHYRNPGKRVTPEEIGLKSVSGPEGSYTTAMIKRRITVGGAMEDEASRRLIDAWHRAERGETFHERHHAFESWKSLIRFLARKCTALFLIFRR